MITTLLTLFIYVRRIMGTPLLALTCTWILTYLKYSIFGSDSIYVLSYYDIDPAQYCL